MYAARCTPARAASCAHIRHASTARRSRATRSCATPTAIDMRGGTRSRGHARHARDRRSFVACPSAARAAATGAERRPRGHRRQ